MPTATKPKTKEQSKKKPAQVPSNETNIAAIRNDRSFKYGDRVIVVVHTDDTSLLLPGHICSSEGSHLNIDNKTKVVVWGDHAFNPGADSADDAHEKSFKIESPFLLRAEDVKALRNPARGRQWFDGTLHWKYADQISALLKKVSLSKTPRSRKNMLRLYRT